MASFNSRYYFSKREIDALLFVLLLLAAALASIGAQAPQHSEYDHTSTDDDDQKTLWKLDARTYLYFFLAFIGIFSVLFSVMYSLMSFFNPWSWVETGRVGGGGGGGGRGLDAAILETFPTFVYSEASRLEIGKGDQQKCAVCFLEFEDNERLRLIPNCYHIFHAHCIDKWLKSKSTCPVCRANLNNTHIGSQNDGVEERPNGQEQDPSRFTRGYLQLSQYYSTGSGSTAT
ncbi:E3 ubiquitin-protein ligase ATL9-like [Cannabis sativa]|uniref:E3 ubiquitin-protein ligase ATL9-like n=1 Tax=Cannabis sativa TaxID=3483 RepID=UPI0011DFAC32|nr:E3 ubiquitin-protein ligase ATL9-like [Cannabis sativa]